MVDEKDSDGKVKTEEKTRKKGKRTRTRKDGVDTASKKTSKKIDHQDSESKPPNERKRRKPKIIEGDEKVTRRKERRKKDRDGSSKTTKTKSRRTEPTKQMSDELNEEDLIDIDFVPSAQHPKYSKDVQRDTPTVVSQPEISSETNVEENEKQEQQRPKITASKSMKNPFNRISKALSHNSSANKKIIRNNNVKKDAIKRSTISASTSDSLVESTNNPPELKQNTKDLVSHKLSNLPGESKISHKRRKVYPTSHNYDKGTRTMLSINDFEDANNQKYPIYIDCSADEFLIKSCKFICYINNIIKEIDLSNNQLTEFKDASHLTKLKRLYLRNNKLKTLDVNGLEFLQVLSVENNCLTNFGVFRNLTSLIHLNASNNNWKDGFEHLHQLKNLQLLDLRSCSINVDESYFTKHFIQAFKNWPSLSHLVLLDNPIFENIPKLNKHILNELPKLQYYNLKETALQKKLEFSIDVQEKSNREYLRLEVEQKRTLPGVQFSPPVAVDFPSVALTRIFKYLSFEDLFQVSLVCREWRLKALDIILTLNDSKIRAFNILAGSCDNNFEKYLSIMEERLPTITLHKNYVSQFQKDILLKERVLIIIFNEADDEFIDIWEEFYNYLTHISSNALSGKKDCTILFPYANYAIFHDMKDNPIIDGIDHLLNFIGCLKIALPNNSDNKPFSEWIEDLCHLLKL